MTFSLFMFRQSLIDSAVVYVINSCSIFWHAIIWHAAKIMKISHIPYFLYQEMVIMWFQSSVLLPWFWSRFSIFICGNKWNGCLSYPQNMTKVVTNEKLHYNTYQNCTMYIQYSVNCLSWINMILCVSLKTSPVFRQNKHIAPFSHKQQKKGISDLSCLIYYLLFNCVLSFIKVTATFKNVILHIVSKIVGHNISHFVSYKKEWNCDF